MKVQTGLRLEGLISASGANYTGSSRGGGSSGGTILIDAGRIEGSGLIQVCDTDNDFY